MLRNYQGLLHVSPVVSSTGYIEHNYLQYALQAQLNLSQMKNPFALHSRTVENLFLVRIPLYAESITGNYINGEEQHAQM